MRKRLSAQIGEDGTATSFDAHFEDGVTDSCNAVPCTPTHWPFALGETGPGTEHLVMEFCLQGADACEIEVHVVEPAPPTYTLVANNEHCRAIAFDGAWTIGSGQIEVPHPQPLTER